MVLIYFIGCLLAFIVNTIFTFIFFNDVKDKNYPLWQKIVLFIITTVIVFGLSWIGLFLASVTLTYRLLINEYD